jgi:GNAT superfamily N-acetyltransferase
MKRIAMNVRIALPADATRVHALLLELGYAPGVEDFLEQFEAHRLTDGTRVFVAVDDDAALTGVLSASVIPLFHQPGSLGRITALVVSSACRGRGVGTALVVAAEDWFRSRGCQRAEVTSGDARVDAHRFYRARGFASASQRFIKKF